MSEAEVYICSAPFSASTSSTKRQSCRHPAQGSTKGCSLPPVLQPDAAAHCLTRKVPQPCLLSHRATSPRQEGTGPPAQLQTQQQLKATPKTGSSFSQQRHENNFSSHWTEQCLGAFVGRAGGLGRDQKGVWGHFSTGERFANRLSAAESTEMLNAPVLVFG